MMRVELESRFNAERVFVKAEDGVDLDGIWIPAFGKEGENSYPTILICNPNAGYYEYAYYQSEWVEYYINLGVNVFLWNYRGYGASKGWPNPGRIQKDGLIIAEYLKETRNITKLGIHGESLGGCIATYIANNSDVAFLFADRTFSSLDSVAYHSFGVAAKFVFAHMTRWNYSSVTDYLS
jgi:alpha/beta superfamily hydrolase